jgi:single-stranded DNA-binding protein
VDINDAEDILVQVMRGADPIWVQCVAFRGQVDALQDFAKGERVALVGDVTLKSWSDGHTALDCIVRNVVSRLEPEPPPAPARRQSDNIANIPDWRAEALRSIDEDVSRLEF